MSHINKYLHEKLLQNSGLINHYAACCSRARDGLSFSFTNDHHSQVAVPAFMTKQMPTLKSCHACLRVGEHTYLTDVLMPRTSSSTTPWSWRCLYFGWTIRNWLFTRVNQMSISEECFLVTCVKSKQRWSINRGQWNETSKIFHTFPEAFLYPIYM